MIPDIFSPSSLHAGIELNETSMDHWPHCLLGHLGAPERGTLIGGDVYMSPIWVTSLKKDQYDETELRFEWNRFPSL